MSGTALGVVIVVLVLAVFGVIIYVTRLPGIKRTGSGFPTSSGDGSSNDEDERHKVQ